jgi:hypothetical protein
LIDHCGDRLPFAGTIKAEASIRRGRTPARSGDVGADRWKSSFNGATLQHAHMV